MWKFQFFLAQQRYNADTDVGSLCISLGISDNSSPTNVSAKLCVEDATGQGKPAVSVALNSPEILHASTSRKCILE